jgi:predicted transcriptional regulator
MEVRLTPEQETQLRQLATRTGKDVEQVVQETVSRMLDHEVRFVEAVKRGMASADRGDFVEHDEVIKARRATVSVLMRIRWTRMQPAILSESLSTYARTTLQPRAMWIRTITGGISKLRLS